MAYVVLCGSHQRFQITQKVYKSLHMWEAVSLMLLMLGVGGSL